MVARVYRLLLRIYRHLPVLPRRWIVRTIAPSFTVGSMVVVERADGRILFVRQTYRRKWGVPGGLLRRRESAHDAAVREVAEEVGLVVEVVGPPGVVIDPIPQRVDVVYRARVRSEEGLDDLRPTSPEISEVAWFSPTELPELQMETSGALIELARSTRDLDPRPVSLQQVGRIFRDRPAG